MTPRKDAERFSRAALMLERATAEIRGPFPPAQRVGFALAAFAAMGLDTSEAEGIVVAAGGGDAAWRPLFAWVVATRETPMARKARMRSALAAAHDVLVKAPSRGRAVNRVLGLGRGRDIPEPLAAAREAAACLNAIVEGMPNDADARLRFALAVLPRSVIVDALMRQMEPVVRKSSQRIQQAFAQLVVLLNADGFDDEPLPAAIRGTADWIASYDYTLSPVIERTAAALAASREVLPAAVDLALDFSIGKVGSRAAARARLLAALPPFTLRGLVDA